MIPTRVKYLPEVQDGQELKRKHSRNHIQMLYLKTTVVVLGLALATVSALLVWQLLNKKDSCRKQVCTFFSSSKQLHFNRRKYC